MGSFKLEGRFIFPLDISWLRVSCLKGIIIYFVDTYSPLDNYNYLHRNIIYEHQVTPSHSLKSNAFNEPFIIINQESINHETSTVREIPANYLSQIPRTNNDKKVDFLGENSLQIEPKYPEQKPFKPQKSPLVLENKKARPSSSQELGWSKEPKVEMLVLSACKTAVGSDEAELGFSGLAVQAGVKTILGSLWYVSIQSSLALMTEFYDQLNTTYFRSESIRQAQLAMLKGKGIALHLLYLSPEKNIPLNQDMTNLGKIDLSHPYYWSAFTVIGNWN